MAKDKDKVPPRDKDMVKDTEDKEVPELSGTRAKTAAPGSTVPAADPATGWRFSGGRFLFSPPAKEAGGELQQQ